MIKIVLPALVLVGVACGAMAMLKNGPARDRWTIVAAVAILTAVGIGFVGVVLPYFPSHIVSMP